MAVAGLPRHFLVGGGGVAVVQFAILGSLQATSDRGPVSLGGLRERVILGVLLADSGRMVPLERLVDAVWEEHPPTTAVKQVRNAVSRLRLVLAGHGIPDAIVAEGAGYRLAVAEGDVDAQVFEARVTAAKRAGQAGELTEAVETLQSALALWRGPLLAGLSGRVVEVAATAWEEQRRSAQDACYEHMLALGRHDEIVAELWAVVADDPLAERPAGQLMRALYGCGRQADALQVYHDSRAALAEQLGLDPG
ncbi:MAG TPA: AfsR/SARP family transcriptional regulator, partial [Streptosporangiaceae bacterium]|nr:AfsR/SARP family transcriptional regulator [Streptosporangiaceae bacterium]